MSPKKLKLTVEPFDDIQIIGINTTLINYQLAWHINNSLNINLIKFPDITHNDNDFFSFYYYDAGENANAYNLVALSNGNSKWVNFSPQTDFLLLIRNYISSEKLNYILQKIKNIQGVSYSYLINLNDNNKIDLVLEEIELHEINILNQQNKTYRSQKNNADE